MCIMGLCTYIIQEDDSKEFYLPLVPFLSKIIIMTMHRAVACGLFSIELISVLLPDIWLFRVFPVISMCVLIIMLY